MTFIGYIGEVGIYIEEFFLFSAAFRISFAAAGKTTVFGIHHTYQIII